MDERKYREIRNHCKRMSTAECVSGKCKYRGNGCGLFGPLPSTVDEEQLQLIIKEHHEEVQICR